MDELFHRLADMLDSRYEITWSCPGHAVADRELTDADYAEQARLAREEWRIEIRPRKEVV